ncbi:hypothetical protein HHK36_010116 [Tetracentron sinense]|uniref:CAP N-terminal domain-containing protein n=1 Tax=Tetracentron sinense TaxID=13715 RepID=A0A834ZK91_TETSI|nr:hypothetical protein HHK36_010116 [Tetracentron sinense]
MFRASCGVRDKLDSSFGSEVRGLQGKLGAVHSSASLSFASKNLGQGLSVPREKGYGGEHIGVSSSARLESSQRGVEEGLLSPKVVPSLDRLIVSPVLASSECVGVINIVPGHGDPKMLDRGTSPTGDQVGRSMGDGDGLDSVVASKGAVEASKCAGIRVVCAYYAYKTNKVYSINTQTYNNNNNHNNPHDFSRKSRERISNKPDLAGLAEFLKPLNEVIMKANALTEGKRPDFFYYLKTAADSLTTSAWIAYSGKDCGMSLPIAHVEESWQMAEFYNNKILVEYKNKDPNHVEWAKSMKELYLPGLRDYVKSFYLLGPVWCLIGKPTDSGPALPPSKAPLPSAPAPPPPPSASLFSSESSGPSSS